MTQEDTPLQIDIISDVMCPWCIVGYRQLSIALDNKGIAHDIRWHPFELNPQMPPEGQDIREHVAQKYGTTRAQSDAARENFKRLGDELGFEFDYKDDARMHNTFLTHQLLHWADTQGRKGDLKQALFAAHFTFGRNLSDVEILADIAAELGLPREDAILCLQDQRFAQDVRAQQQSWIQKGISGVPAVVFENKHLVTGAQGVENYENILDQLIEMRG